MIKNEMVERIYNILQNRLNEMYTSSKKAFVYKETPEDNRRFASFLYELMLLDIKIENVHQQNKKRIQDLKINPVIERTKLSAQLFALPTSCVLDILEKNNIKEKINLYKISEEVAFGDSYKYQKIKRSNNNISRVLKNKIIENRAYYEQFYTIKEDDIELLLENSTLHYFYMYIASTVLEHAKVHDNSSKFANHMKYMSKLWEFQDQMADKYIDKYDDGLFENRDAVFDKLAFLSDVQKYWLKTDKPLLFSMLAIEKAPTKIGTTVTREDDFFNIYKKVINKVQEAYYMETFGAYSMMLIVYRIYILNAINQEGLDDILHELTDIYHELAREEIKDIKFNEATMSYLKQYYIDAVEEISNQEDHDYLNSRLKTMFYTMGIEQLYYSNRMILENIGYEE